MLWPQSSVLPNTRSLTLGALIGAPTGCPLGLEGLTSTAQHRTVGDPAISVRPASRRAIPAKPAAAETPRIPPWRAAPERTTRARSRDGPPAIARARQS